MASQTSNLGLILPVGTEYVSRQIINSNMSTIDGAIGALPSGKTLQGEINDIENSKGTAGGFAELDNTGKVPSAQLPSYVDDVQEYDSVSSFPATGETGTIYVAKDTNKTYRWSGTGYVEISPSLALGETSSTAYRGDRGKAAYDHATQKGSAFVNGMYKFTTNGEGHVTSASEVQKSDIKGLGIPGNEDLPGVELISGNKYRIVL